MRPRRHVPSISSKIATVCCTRAGAIPPPAHSPPEVTSCATAITTSSFVSVAAKANGYLFTVAAAAALPAGGAAIDSDMARLAAPPSPTTTPGFPPARPLAPVITLTPPRVAVEDEEGGKVFAGPADTKRWSISCHRREHSSHGVGRAPTQPTPGPKVSSLAPTLLFSLSI